MSKPNGPDPAEPPCPLTAEQQAAYHAWLDSHGGGSWPLLVPELHWSHTGRWPWSPFLKSHGSPLPLFLN